MTLQTLLDEIIRLKNLKVIGRHLKLKGIKETVEAVDNVPIVWYDKNKLLWQQIKNKLNIK